MEKNYAIAAKADLVEIMKLSHFMRKQSKQFGHMKDSYYYHGFSEGLAHAIGDYSIYHTAEKSGYTIDKAKAKLVEAKALSVVYENRKEINMACYMDGKYDAMRLYLTANGEERVA